LGAASAGLKFGAYYPMTPGTSLMLSLIKLAKYCDIKIEQAEDEISAINMAIGAAYAGAPAFVGTSGGGFALMAEGVSLAGIIETPVVVGIAQRPGPATGLPTRTEQGDLDFVLHGGHGEFVRAVYAPGSIEEFFNIGRKAMETADKFQTPVFILSDQYMSDSYRAVLPFDIESLEPTCPMVETDTDQDPYERYAITDSGISPRLVPGDTKNLVVVDSDEHTPDGHLTEDLDVRVEMADKRLRKMEGMLKEVIPPTHVGQNEPDLLLVCWGSSRGSVNQVVAELNDSNTSAAMLHFSQVWPLVPDQFLDKLEEAKRVVAVESNAFGQFARLIRRETGFHIPDMILRYDGMPITPEYIHRKLSEME
jgi:2-oxoglutarate ferredoxin oxidoreductase subunit alpha